MGFWGFGVFGDLFIFLARENYFFGAFGFRDFAFSGSRYL